jgi:hypothetical protein
MTSKSPKRLSTINVPTATNIAIELAAVDYAAIARRRLTKADVVRVAVETAARHPDTVKDVLSADELPADQQTVGMLTAGITGPVRDAAGLDTRGCGIPEMSTVNQQDVLSADEL